MDCKGLVNTTDDSLLPPGAWSLNATSLKDRARNTNADIWRAADSLHQLACNGRAYGERSKELGLTYNPRGILWDLSLRHIHKPIDSYIRDWMHIWVSGGVCSSQIFGLKGALKDNGIPISMVRTYSLEVTLPGQYGTVSAAWLDDNRFSDNDFSSFASYQLTLVPIIGAFLDDCVKPHNIMMQHIECFLLLVQIIGLLSSGADYAVQHMPLLAMLIVEHHKLYVQLYPDLIKPKFHHILHLPELYARLRKVISCFVAIPCSGILCYWCESQKSGQVLRLMQGSLSSMVLLSYIKVTERKHKSVKGASLFVFRHLEHTALSSILNAQCEQIIAGHSLFQREFLVSPSSLGLDFAALSRSSSIVLECGHLAVDDIVYIGGGSIARAQCFYELNGCFTMQCIKCVHLRGHVYRDGTSVSFVACNDIVDSVAYRTLADNSLRIILPWKARFF